MAEKDPENGPTLELPSLFGRRRRRAEEARGTETPAPESGAGSPSAAGGTTAVRERPDATAVLPVVEEPRVEPVEEPAPPAAAHAPAAPPTPAPYTGSSSAGGRRRAAPAAARTLPELSGTTAALVVGAAVGVLGCVLTFLGLKGCELATGTDSCGGPGLLVLGVILFVMVLAGVTALRALQVADAGSLSFLGVGITSVLVLLFLVDRLYKPWMFLVVPVLTALSFGLAHWVTTRYTDDVLDDDDDRMPRHDIR